MVQIMELLILLITSLIYQNQHPKQNQHLLKQYSMYVSKANEVREVRALYDGRLDSASTQLKKNLMR